MLSERLRNSISKPFVALLRELFLLITSTHSSCKMLFSEASNISHLISGNSKYHLNIKTKYQEGDQPNNIYRYRRLGRTNVFVNVWVKKNVILNIRSKNCFVKNFVQNNCLILFWVSNNIKIALGYLNAYTYLFISAAGKFPHFCFHPDWWWFA